ncbi:MAG TPA: YggU family protein [Holosporales bacterium]|nr:YggU family protein [Holosporales bacterium]
MLFCPPLKDMPIKETLDGVILYIKVTPNAVKNKIGSIEAGQFHTTLKIFIQEPAVDGKANKAVIHFLQNLFNCPKNAISIQSGQLQRAKSVLITGFNAKDIIKKII